MPILTDDERQAVGTCYRERGQEAAIALGVELTAPHRDDRIDSWRQAVKAFPGATAFACWRGGQRSRIAQQWLADDSVPRVTGGSKALRRFLLARLQAHFDSTQAIVISGLTGCGKTELLQALAPVVPQNVLALDLEDLANHRGSAFGGFPSGQPAQQTFENHLAATVQSAAPRLTILEDEARNVGRLELPEYVWMKTKGSPVVIVEASHQERIARIAQEYVFKPTDLSSRAVILQDLQTNINKLAKRLGGVRMNNCLAALADADHDERWHTVEAHTPWIDTLLLHYYDKFYDSAMVRLDRPVTFRGSQDEIIDWFRSSGFAV